MAWAAIGASVAGAGASYLLNRGSGSSSPTNTTTSQTSSPQSNSSTWSPNPSVSSIYDWLARQAQSLGGAQQPYYPGQTYVSPSSLTQQGVSGMQQAAGMAPGIAQMQQRGLGVANQNYGMLSNAADVANNPYVQGMLGVNNYNTNQQLKNEWLPALTQGAIASGSGGMGSSRAGLAQAQAIGNASQQLSNANANLLYNSYGQGLGAQQTALGQTGSMLQNQMAPANTMGWGAGVLGQAGQTVEGYQQQALRDQMARYNYGYQQPWTNIGNVGGILQMLQNTGVQQGTGGGTSSSIQTSPNQNYQNPWTQAIGGAITGYGLYNQYKNS
jgi:hypothetical protein